MELYRFFGDSDLAAKLLVREAAGEQAEVVVWSCVSDASASTAKPVDRFWPSSGSHRNRLGSRSKPSSLSAIVSTLM